MREAYGDLWDLVRDNGGVLVITTNGTVKKDGRGVMGRGIALEASRRYPDLPERLGRWLTAFGNTTAFHPYSDLTLVTMPVKHNWWEKADPDLIVTSAADLRWLADDQGWTQIWCPRPGCGNGQLRWEAIKPLLDAILDDRFIAVTK